MSLSEIKRPALQQPYPIRSTLWDGPTLSANADIIIDTSVFTVYQTASAARKPALCPLLIASRVKEPNSLDLVEQHWVAN